MQGDRHSNPASMVLGRPSTSVCVVLNCAVWVFLFICVAVVIYLIPLWGRQGYFASQIQRYFHHCGGKAELFLQCEHEVEWMRNQSKNGQVYLSKAHL